MGNLNLIYIDIFLKNLLRRNKLNIYSFVILRKNQLGSKFKLVWLIIILIRKEIRSIIFGIVSIFVPRMKRKRRQHLPDVIQNLMWVILLLISSMIKMGPIFAYSLLEVAVQLELTANIIIESLPSKIVKQSTRLRIFLVEPDSAHSDKI